MAERRMFAKSVIDSDMFLDMSLSTQALYFHLAMRADDDGFVNNPKRIQRMIGASDDELKILIAKQYIFPFESGVVVIKHWKVHNYIQKDRYHPSTLSEKQLLKVNNDNTYEVLDTECIQPCIQDGNIGKVRLGKVRLDNNILSGEPDGLSAKVKEIIDYLNEKSGKKYRYSTPKTKSLIKARLKESFVLHHFKLVIDNKCSQWLGTDMEKYLRPETLFGTKFEGYLNEVGQAIAKEQQRPIVKSTLPDMTDEEAERLRREMYGES